jgi:hypothetical protein
VSLRFEMAKPLGPTPFGQSDKGLRGFLSLSSSF